MTFEADAVWVSLVAFFIFGYVMGRMRTDVEMWRMNQAQQDRGNYWFDKYMSEVRDDWEPLSEDFNG